MADAKCRGWLTLVYPESEKDGWRDYLCEMGLPFVISPLHEFDTNADGELKKPHYHVLLYWDGPTTYKHASEVIADIGGVGCKKLASVRGSVRYFAHLDNPEKYQYDPSLIVAYGGIDLDRIIYSESDDILLFAEICSFIDDYHVFSFRQLLRYCYANHPDWAKFILTKFRENTLAYQRSAIWEQDQANQGLNFTTAEALPSSESL